MFDSSRALVLDANILIRAVLGKRVRSLIEQYATQVFLCTPDLCFVEAERHLPEIVARRGGDRESATVLLAALSPFITEIDVSFYGAYRDKAQERIDIRDPNDWHVLALALLLDCPIWTEDSDFFGAGVATWTTDRVHLYLDDGC
jgi:predicted nucleic acid-binding protein